MCVAKNPKLHTFGREKVHIVSAGEISTFLCVEMAMSMKILGIDSEREILTFLYIDIDIDSTLISFLQLLSTMSRVV